MEITYIDEVIILRKQPYREQDGLISVFGALGGRLNLVARGTQKVNSKLNSHLEALTRVKIMVVQGKHFNYIGSAHNLDTYLDLKENLPRLLTTGRAIGIVLQLLKNKAPDIEIFELLKNFLELSNRASKVKENKENLFYYFVFKFLSILGYGFDLSTHVKSEAKTKKYFFDVKNGVLFNNKIKEGIELDSEAISIIKSIYERSSLQMADLKIEKPAKLQLKQVLIAYLHYNYGIAI